MSEDYVPIDETLDKTFKRMYDVGMSLSRIAVLTNVDIDDVRLGLRRAYMQSDSDEGLNKPAHLPEHHP